MENSITRWVYDHSPVVMQNLFTTLYGWQKARSRYSGRYYREFYDFFSQSAKWSYTELRAYQDEKLREVVTHAYEHVPFYRNRFDELKLEPQDIRTVDDLPKLPVLTKAEVRQAGTLMLADDYDRKKHYVTRSSGSTGFPMISYRDQRANAVEYAFIWARARPHVSRGERYASFAGLQLCRSDSMKPPFWRINRASNQRCYSIFHLTEATIPYYLEDLERHPCAWFQGYPTPMYLLARYILDHNISFTASPRAVFTTSEQLQPHYREAIEKAFHTRVYDQYGQDEQCALILQHECGHYHVAMDFSIVETTPVGEDDGCPLAEVIGTTLYNNVMPRIRYCVGDQVVLPKTEQSCSYHPTPIISRIHGRTNNVLFTKDGRGIGNISVVATRATNIKAMQCVQDVVGQVRVRVIRADGFGESDKQRLLRLLYDRIGAGIDIEIEYVDELIRTSSGKVLQIISKVDQK